MSYPVPVTLYQSPADVSEYANWQASGKYKLAPDVVPNMVEGTDLGVALAHPAAGSNGAALGAVEGWGVVTIEDRDSS